MTTTSRRSLLRAGAIGAVLAPLVPSWFTPASASGGLYYRPRFERLVSRKFTIAGPTGRWQASLVKVSDAPGAARGDRKCYDLTFRTAVAGPRQGTYHLKRYGFTTTSLFLVPSDKSRRTYRAVINRL